MSHMPTVRHLSLEVRASIGGKSVVVQDPPHLLYWNYKYREVLQSHGLISRAKIIIDRHWTIKLRKEQNLSNSKTWRVIEFCKTQHSTVSCHASTVHFLQFWFWQWWCNLLKLTTMLDLNTTISINKNVFDWRCSTVYRSKTVCEHWKKI